MLLTTFQKGRRNDFDGLRYIHKFGWLRPTELATFLWPRSSSAKKNMSALLAKWRRLRYVIERKLPENYGTALVLAAAGAELLTRNEIEAKTGKDWGTVTACGWRPPHVWKHQLMQAATATWFTKRSFEVKSEPEIRATVECADDYPDLLVRGKDNNRWWWIEIENARKSGRFKQRRGYQKDLAPLAKLSSTLISAGRGMSFGPFDIDQGLFVYDPNALDERGHKLDHASRFLSHMKQRPLKSKTSIYLVPLKMVGGTVTDLDFVRKDFYPS